MSIGEQIIAAIENDRLVVVDDVVAPLLFGGSVYAWKGNAAEQLEAVVEAYMEERVRVRLELDRKAMFELSREELTIVTGCIDSLGVALTRHNHQWTDGERTIYEEAMRALGMLDNFNEPSTD